LTSVPTSATSRQSRSNQGRRPVTPSGGASAVPAGGGSSPSHSGGLGISLPALRPVREVLSLDWDRQARVTPVEKREVSAPRLGRAYRTERSGRVPGSMA